jgi:HD-GYP domain-containing protein (c-di-GMP phosphodiesterase class II)
VFDPAVVDALKELSRDETFWAEFEAHDIRDRVLALEPESDWRLVDEARIEDVALAFADFIDLKSRYKAAHSRRVGAIAEQLARIMRCAEEAVTQIRRAGLMHDLGVVAIPSYSLDRPWRELSESERDACRLYPYHGERILKRVPALAPLAEMVGTHQERMDGSGYYRGMSGQQISLGARIIAVADRLDELTHDGAANTALPVTQALDVLASEPLDQEVLGALRRSLGEQAIVVAAPPRHPASLTDREIEVLTLMTQGMTRREIGHRLAISEHTVRNHLDHIYDKTGTSNRVSATMFAMENGILAP